MIQAFLLVAIGSALTGATTSLLTGIGVFMAVVGGAGLAIEHRKLEKTEEKK